MIRELKGHFIDKAFAEGEVITSNMGHDDDGLPIDEKFYADDGRCAGEKEAAEEQHRLEAADPWDAALENEITRSLRKFRGEDS